MGVTASKRPSSRAEQVFDMLLCDSVTEVFNKVLGQIAGQALLDAVRRHASLEVEDFPRKPDVLDRALVATMGSSAQVLERKILKTLTGKAAAGTPPSENLRFDFASEIEKVKEQFLKGKQAAVQPHTVD